MYLFTAKKAGNVRKFVATLVDEREFLAMMQTRMQAMLSLLLYLSKCESPAGVPTARSWGSLLSEAVQLEEVLDSYDAGKNRTWCHGGP